VCLIFALTFADLLTTAIMAERGSLQDETSQPTTTPSPITAAEIFMMTEDREFDKMYDNALALLQLPSPPAAPAVSFAPAAAAPAAPAAPEAPAASDAPAAADVPAAPDTPAAAAAPDGPSEVKEENSPAVEDEASKEELPTGGIVKAAQLFYENAHRSRLN
jgi:hypothetical protein